MWSMNVLFLIIRQFDTSKCGNPQLESTVNDFKVIFCTTPDKTNDAYHIHTPGNPIRVPPRRVPIHYQTEVMQQLEIMLDQGIIKHNKRPLQYLDGSCSFCSQKVQSA